MIGHGERKIFGSHSVTPAYTIIAVWKLEALCLFTIFQQKGTEEKSGEGGRKVTFGGRVEENIYAPGFQKILND